MSIQYLQLYRLLVFCVLFILTAMMFFIYLDRFVVQVQAWSLVASLLAFWYLFTSAGKQVCYQKRVRDPFKYKISWDNTSEDLWLTAVFFYNVAFSLSFSSLIMYNIRFPN